MIWILRNNNTTQTSLHDSRDDAVQAKSKAEKASRAAKGVYSIFSAWRDEKDGRRPLSHKQF